MSRRWAPRVDMNQLEVVKALRACGALVLSLASLGGGVPDLLVLSKGKLFLVEVKRPPGKKGGTAEAGQRLNPAQEKFQRAWGSVLFIVHSAEEAVDILNGVSRVVELEG